MTRHAQTAREHVHAVQASRHDLDELIAQPSSPGRSQAIDRASAAMHLGAKLALVHAVLAVAEAIDQARLEREA